MNLIIKYLTLIKAKLKLMTHAHISIYKTILDFKLLLSKGFLRIIITRFYSFINGFNIIFIRKPTIQDGRGLYDVLKKDMVKKHINQDN